MTGLFFKCLVSVWIVPVGQVEALPHNTEATCQVLREELEENHLVKTGAPDMLLIDCSKSLGWLKPKYGVEFYVEKKECK